jgi:DNA-directed RNA polymerase specialized sigma24 family protein
MKQIGEELGKSSQAVKISLFRTRKAMGAKLEALDLRQSA